MPFVDCTPTQSNLPNIIISIARITKTPLVAGIREDSTEAAFHGGVAKLWRKESGSLSMLGRCRWQASCVSVLFVCLCLCGRQVGRQAAGQKLGAYSASELSEASKLSFGLQRLTVRSLQQQGSHEDTQVAGRNTCEERKEWGRKGGGRGVRNEGESEVGKVEYVILQGL